MSLGSLPGGAAWPWDYDADLASQTCEACTQDHYRNAKPCAGVLIERGGRLLLARRAIAPAAGAWNIVGGFVEPGETPSEAAVREALEETGLHVRLSDLLCVERDLYPSGPGLADVTLNLYYMADSSDGEPVAASDVAELAWFDASELPCAMAFAHEPAVLARWREAVGTR
jgi:8-oxo-dGTP diphosphatase